MPEAAACRPWRFGPDRWRRGGVTGGMLLYFALLTLLPVAALVREALAGGGRPFLTLARAPEARHAFGLTLAATAACVLLHSAFGVVLALLLTRCDFRGKALLDAVLDMPFAVSPVVAGFMFLLLFGPQGWLGRWIEAAGLQVVFAWPGILLATLFVSLPFVTREVAPVLEEVGTEQEEAAETLGAGPWATFWHVTLPTIQWGLAYGVSLTAARALGEFGAVLVVSGAIIGKTQTATLFVHQEFTDFHYQGAYAAALVLALASIALLLLMEAFKRAAGDRP